MPLIQFDHHLLDTSGIHLEQTLEWIAQIRPRLAVLTNLHVDMDYGTLARDLPNGVVPAYDGQPLEFIV